MHRLDEEDRAGVTYYWRFCALRPHVHFDDVMTALSVGTDAEDAEQDDDDEPANPAKDERTNHDIGERIELLRLDEMVIWFGAHHVLCAGCRRVIGTEARWDFYNGGLWHKHKYRNCKGFKRWEEKLPSKEDLMAWQKSRNQCADGLVSLLPSSMGRMMC